MDPDSLSYKIIKGCEVNKIKFIIYKFLIFFPFEGYFKRIKKRRNVTTK